MPQGLLLAAQKYNSHFYPELPKRVGFISLHTLRSAEYQRFGPPRLSSHSSPSNIFEGVRLTFHLFASFGGVGGRGMCGTSGKADILSAFKRAGLPHFVFSIFRVAAARVLSLVLTVLPTCTYQNVSVARAKGPDHVEPNCTAFVLQHYSHPRPGYSLHQLFQHPQKRDGAIV